MRVPPAHLTYRAHCTVEVSCFLRHAAEHSPKTSTWSGVVTCVAHGHQGSRMRPTTHALVHSVHRNPPPPRPTGERRGHRRRLPPAGAGREEGPPEGPGVHREHRGDHVLRADPAPGTLNGLGLCPAGVAACLSKHSTTPHCHLSQNNILPEVLEVPSPLLWKYTGSQSLRILLSKDEAEMGQHLRSTCQLLTASAGSLLRGIYELESTI